MARPVLLDLERGGGAHHQCAVRLHGHAAAGKASSVIVARNGEIQPLVGQPRLSEKGMEDVRRPVRQYRLVDGAKRPRQNLHTQEEQQPAWHGRSTKPVRAILVLGEKHEQLDYGISTETSGGGKEDGSTCNTR